MKKNIKSSYERGYGREHKTIRRYLLFNHVDGSLCDWCGQPMFRDASRNFDSAPLEADHSVSLADTNRTSRADRLLHRKCNRQKGSDSDDSRSPLNNLVDEHKEVRDGVFRW